MLTNTILTSTSTAIESFTCEICETAFTSSGRLKDHNVRLHGGNGRTQKRKIVLVPERRTTLFALGTAVGLVAAGSAAWYLAKRRKIE